MLAGLAPMEEVERTNVLMVCPNQQTRFALYNLYTMKVDRKNNCYNYKGFGHLARNCRNRGTGGKIGQERRMEYGGCHSILNPK